ncbi:hypothetical protein MKEN_01474400 [Mycena kentingensis (nom. inval.)]|nr:hypothetical protein MKEN_01474400 [Mycena kentingensis (nom. inval.)]
MDSLPLVSLSTSPDQQIEVAIQETRVATAGSFGNILGSTVQGNLEVNIVTFQVSPSPTTTLLPNPEPSVLSNAVSNCLVSASPLLRDILGITWAFLQPPSLLQLKRVLEPTHTLRWSEVHAAIAASPLAALLGFGPNAAPSAAVELYSNVEIASELRRALGESAILSTEQDRYHTAVAVWCIRQNTLDPRDVVYSRMFWDAHLRHSTPSPELLDALRSSETPIARLAREIPRVAAWLKLFTTSESG